MQNEKPQLTEQHVSERRELEGKSLREYKSENVILLKSNKIRTLVCFKLLITKFRSHFSFSEAAQTLMV